MKWLTQAATLTSAAALLVTHNPPSIQAAQCPTYEAIANTGNPLVANFSVDAFLGHWVEVRSRNVPGLTTGCSCTRYNCTSASPVKVSAAHASSVVSALTTTALLVIQTAMRCRHGEHVCLGRTLLLLPRVWCAIEF